MPKQAKKASIHRERDLDDWITREAIPFSVDLPATFNAAVAKVVSSLDDSVELLGFGEAMHGGEDIVVLRNQLFQRLVEAHGYSAIAIESSFPRARMVNAFVAGDGPTSYDTVQETGFSHGFGRLAANRELVEWMRGYNADQSHRLKLQFYGFDSPTEIMFGDSPRHVLYVVLDYLASIDSTSVQAHRERIDPLLGKDTDWENPAAAMDPTKSIGLSPTSTALRIATEDLLTYMQIHRPELVAKSDAGHFTEAVHYASMAQQLLNYHATMADLSSDRNNKLVGIRDAMMADNLAYIVSREHGRGKVLAFAHNNHLQRGMTQMQLGPVAFTWWPAGAHLDAIFGPRYAVIGSAVGVSDANGIGQPEAVSLEARLIAVPGPARFIPTHKGQGLPASEIAALLPRTGSKKNPTYMPLTPLCFTDFDWLAVLDSST